MSNFKPGDVVQLKSGGPLMTIENVGNYGGVAKAHCQWFDGPKSCADTFPLSSLELDSDD